MKLNTGKFTIERLVEFKETVNTPYQWNNGRIIMAYEIGRVRLALVNVNPIEDDKFNLETPEGVRDLELFLKDNPDMEAYFKLEIFLPLTHVSVNKIGNEIFGEDELKYKHYLTDSLVGSHMPELKVINKNEFVPENFELTIESFKKLQETHPALFDAICVNYNEFYSVKELEDQSYTEYTIAGDKTDSIFYNEGYTLADLKINDARLVLQVANSNSTNRVVVTTDKCTYDLNGIEEIREFVRDDNGVFNLFNDSEYLDADVPAFELKLLLPYGVDSNGDTIYILDSEHPTFPRDMLFDFCEFDIPDISSFRETVTHDFDTVVETIKEFYDGYLNQTNKTSC